MDFYSVDSAGNAETPKQTTVVVDKTGPAFSIEGIPAQPTSQTVYPWVLTTETGSVTVATVDGLPFAFPGNVADEGEHHIVVTLFDEAGNFTTHDAYFTIDKTAPVTTAHPSESSPTSHTVTVSADAVDAGSGVAATYYSLDGGGWLLWSSDVSVADEGAHTLDYYSVDKAGNAETPKSLDIVVDKTAPVTTADVTPAAVTSQSVTVSLSASDTLSAPVTTYASVNGGAYEVYSAPLHFTADGVYTVDFHSVDSAGNAETPKNTTVTIDSVGPDFDLLPAPGTHVTNFWLGVINRDHTDVRSEVTIDGAPYAWGDPITAEGTHTITLTLFDALGNSTTKTTSEVIDQTGPTTTPHASPSTLSSQTISVSFDVADPYDSTPTTTYYRLDGDPTQYQGTGPLDFTTEGTHTIDYESFDALGNEEVGGLKHFEVVIDRTGPAFSIEGIPADATSSTVTPSISTTETSYTATATLDGEPFTVGDSVSTEGTHTLEVTLTDDAGNTTTHSVTFVVDKTAPVTDWHASPSAISSSTITVTLDATDALSGVAATYYRVDEGDWQPYSGGFDIADEGPHTVHFYSVDKAGNAESEQTAQVVVDKTAPVSDAWGTSWVSGTATFTISATDTGTGVAATHYSVDGGLPQLYTMPVGIDIEGTHTVTYFSVDQVGNVEVGKTITVYVDDTPPVTTDDAPVGIQNHAPIPVTLTATDTLSGVAYTMYSIDSGTETTYTGPIEIDAPGTTTIHYYSVDNAGNAEAPKQTQVQISTALPDVHVTGVAEGGSYRDTVTPGFYSTDPEASLVATLNGSSFTSGSPVSDEGSYTLVVTATNALGLRAAETVHFTIDRTAPDITILGVTDGACYGHAVSPDATTTDLTASLEATLDGAPFALGSAVSAEGSHTLVASATDPAGNRATATVEFLVDLTPPTTTDDAPSQTQARIVPVTLTANDALSGVAHTFYQLNGSEPTTYTGSIAVGADGTTTITYWSVDRAGNVETSHSVDVNIDRTPPSGTMVVDNGASRTATIAVTVDSVVADAVDMRIDSGAGYGSWIAYSPSTPAQLTDGDGVKTVHAQYRDALGNVLTLTDTIVLDTTAPSIKIDGVTDSHTYNTPRTPDISTDDPDALVESTLNGEPFVSGTEISVDGTYTIETTATDTLGNSSHESLTFYIDRTAPDVVIEGVTEGAVYDHSVAPKVYSNDPTALVSATLNGSSFVSGSTVSEAGEYTLVGTAHDPAGNTVSTTVHFTIKAPQGTVLPPVVMDRVGGKDRYDTAAGAADAVFKRAPVVIIATGRTYPDALSASSLAGHYHAPLLIVKPTQVPASVKSELKKLRTKKVIVLGDTRAVGDGAVKTFKSMGLSVQRIGGKNRFATAIAIEAEVARLEGRPASKTVYLARGDAFQDALTIAPTAYRTKSPILLCSPRGIDSGTLASLRRYKKVIIIGGTNSVSSGVEGKARAAVANTTRLGGSDFYETAYLVAGWQIDQGLIIGNRLYLATGQIFPDAMCGGVVAGEANAGLMLTTSASLESRAEKLLAERRAWIRDLRVLGGTGAVSDAALARAREVLAGK